MLSHLFLGMSLIGAEWVLYLLVILSILSVTLIFERGLYYRKASQGLDEFREKIRALLSEKKFNDALRVCEERSKKHESIAQDLEAPLAVSLLRHSNGSGAKSVEVLSELARDAVVRGKIQWDRNLSILATIGSNAPFIGLFGTVLGIIKAFHDLSQQAGTGAATVTAGISEALVATAVGLLVAIPAVVAYNMFQRRVKSAVAESEALKSFIIAKLAE